MSLTLEKLRRLKAKGFDQLYVDHSAKWIATVTNGKTYAESYINGADVIRHGDLSLVIQNAIRVDPHFEAHAKAKSLQQKYWVEWFADYILDQIYPTQLDP